MPKPPGLVDKVNYIVDFVEDPCGAPWTVYIECMLPALGELVLVLIDVDPVDIIRAYTRPGGLRSHSHLRRKRKGKKGTGGIPDVNEMIGKKVPGRALLKARKVSNGVRALWLIDNLGQRLLWYWLVINLTIDFFYTWSSLVNKSVFCSLQHLGAVVASGPGGGFLAITGFTAVTANTIEKQRGNVTWSGGAVTVADSPVNFSCGLEFQNVGLFPQEFEMVLSKNPFGTDPITTDTTGTIAPGDNGSCVINALLTDPGTYIVLGKPSVGESIGIQCLVSAIETG